MMSDESSPIQQKAIYNEFQYTVTSSSNLYPENIKEPVIVLFGWGGCIDRNLSKYSAMYEERGCTTFRCIVISRLLFPGKINESRLHRVACKIVSILHELKFEDHPLIFHAFSNGGASVYRFVSQVMRSNTDYHFQVKGCIFDSAPAKVSSQGIISAVVNAVKGSFVIRYTTAILALTYIHTVSIYNWISSLFCFQYPTSKRYILWETLVEEPNICPQLFLFSKADDICTYESIQEFANERKKKGVKVTTVIWEDSPHVQHMVMFKEEYVNAILKFIGPYLSAIKHLCNEVECQCKC